MLLVIGSVAFGNWRTAHSFKDGANVLRIFGYNIHNGFNVDGDLDLEALAQVIEKQQPDIVSLQEVSRGWVVNGSVDAMAWLAQRLDMVYAYSGPDSLG